MRIAEHVALERLRGDVQLFDPSARRFEVMYRHGLLLALCFTGGAGKERTSTLLFEPSTPVEVILDEAVEIARRFSGDSSPAFVNGVLDVIAGARAPASP